MANHKSAAKRARQTVNKRARNSGTKKSVRTVEKSLRAAIDKKDKKEAMTFLKKFESLVQKAAQKGILHSNNASRRVSRIAKRVTSL